MVDKEQAKTFLDMLFEPNDLFEVRVRTNTQKGASQHWIPKVKQQQFIETHLPIHHTQKRHVWVGVGPRDRVGSTNPALNRALWVDLDASVTTEGRLNEAISNSGLPEPTMVVWSGNGYHLYWKLTEAVESGQVRPYSMGVHASLPSDNTHDPTRVMRVPGTWNFKNEGDPKQCRILKYDPELKYDLTRFPRVQSESPGQVTESKPSSKGLSTEDFDLFVTNWLDGQKHTMAVAVAGYLRKNLYMGQEQCLDTIRQIHQAAGYSWPDDNLRKVVSDTYSLMLHQVSGLSKLHDLGVVPSVKEGINFKFLKPPTPKVPLIDFNNDIEPQEFWAQGLVGPGMLTIWAAQPKSGKSFAVMQLGHALSKGQDIWGFRVPKAVRVLYFQGELSKNMVAERAISMFGRESLRNPRQFAMTDKPQETISLIDHPEVLNDISEHYDVIIVDPLSAFNSNDENSFTSVRETISVFDSLKAKGKAVVVVHHTRKLQTNRDGSIIPPTSNDIRGSSAWFGAADAIAMQYNTPDGNSAVKFTFRAAAERDVLKLYRQLNGGFTDRYQEYLAEHDTLRIPANLLN